MKQKMSTTFTITRRQLLKVDNTNVKMSISQYLLPFESKWAFDFSDMRISVGVMIVRTAQKKNITTKVLSIFFWRKLMLSDEGVGEFNTRT
jgi:hypothetical protein